MRPAQLRLPPMGMFVISICMKSREIIPAFGIRHKLLHIKQRQEIMLAPVGHSVLRRIMFLPELYQPGKRLDRPPSRCHYYSIYVEEFFGHA